MALLLVIQIVWKFAQNTLQTEKAWERKKVALFFSLQIPREMTPRNHLFILADSDLLIIKR